MRRMRGGCGLLALVLAAACARPGAGPVPVQGGAADIIGTVAERREVQGGVSVLIQ